MHLKVYHAKQEHLRMLRAFLKETLAPDGAWFYNYDYETMELKTADGRRTVAVIATQQ